MAKEFDYKCRFCPTIFDGLNEIIKHLKNAHDVKEKKGKIHCCVNRTSCPSYFFSFSGLKNHVKKCVETRYDDDESHLKIQNEINQFSPSNTDVPAEVVQPNTNSDVRIAKNTHVILSQYSKLTIHFYRKIISDSDCYYQCFGRMLNCKQFRQ